MRKRRVYNKYLQKRIAIAAFLDSSKDKDLSAAHQENMIALKHVIRYSFLNSSYQRYCHMKSEEEPQTRLFYHLITNMHSGG